MTVAPGQLEFVDGPEPLVGAEDALIAVESVGICGSDIHLYLGDHPYSHFPNVQGHEFAGRVMLLPADYHGSVHVDDRVAVEPLLMCGHCLPCRRGRGNCCVNMRTLGAQIDGALAERIAVPASLLQSVGNLSADLAALVEPVSIGLQAVGRSRLEPGDTAVIYGAGPIGQAILLGAVDRGARVLVVDRLASRLHLARELGAEITVDASAGGAPARIAAWTDGDGPVTVFEATGVPSVAREAVDVVAPSGTVVIVGLSNDSLTVPMIEFTRKELSVIGSRNNMGLFAEAAQLVERHRDQAARLISHRFPFSRGIEAFELARTSPATTEKVIITMESVNA